jgi:ABC-type molybdate transport system substrate-binding protein
LNTGSRSVSLFSTIAVQKALENVSRAFIEETGTALDATYEPTNKLLNRITAGARPDVVIGLTAQLAPLGAAGIVDMSTSTPLASVRVGIAVAPTAPAQDISTVDALINTLTSARSVAYSQTGASGLYFAGLLQRLGIEAQVNEHATMIDKGFTAAAIVDGRADIAVQLLSEHLCVPEARILGPLPDEVQQITEFSAVLGAAAASQTGPQALLRFLTGPKARDAYERTGMVVNH